MTPTHRNLESYVAGRWHASPHPGAVLTHAVSGEPVGEVSSAGIDSAEMVMHARSQGGPNIRKLTFHERALLLKTLGGYLLERKESLYALSTATGATRSDSWIDIEGGIGTLFAMSSKARIEMPNGHVYLDGQPERLSRKGSFIGQHIYSSTEGVAVQINAFNFPCWGLLEKFAPAFIAGLPTIVKPASQTSFVAEQLVRLIIESDILPTGALQFIAGNAGDLLDHLTYQDVLAFTGSAKTGLELKQHPVVARENTRFMMEADSLNCSILGRDVLSDSPEFDLYISELVREITAKAGQKCTAIRRAIVPAPIVDAVVDELNTQLSKLVIGNPANSSVQMGALAGFQQRTDVQTALVELQQDNHCMFGFEALNENLGDLPLVDANASVGAFMPPVVMLAKNAHTSSANHIEAFGPVCTLMPYEDEQEAVAIAACGKGSLVASLITGSQSIARETTLGIATHHGRILVLDTAAAAESTGHGSPLPQLIHGGPGRAGGGEEQGGIRGALHYMQRTAIQGSPDMLSAITQTNMPGATAKLSAVHPFKKHFEHIEIGETVVTEKRTVTLEDIEAFADLTGDHFYAHMDEDAAKRNPFFDGRVAHGYFLISAAAGLFVWPGEGPVLANTGLENLSFQKPVYPGDTIQVQFTCKQKKDRLTETWGEVRWDTTIVNQRGEVCANYDVLTGVANATDA